MIAAIVQARTGSTRLPGKIFANLAGKPFIWHVVNRLKTSKKIEKIILAIPDSAQDNALEEWATENKLACFRGNETDVLARFYFCAKKFSIPTIVRITADDPFKDASIIDQVINLYQNQNIDFAYNNKPPSFPEGMDTEVFSFAALKKAHAEAKDPFEREHVTQYFFRHPELFKQANLAYSTDLSYLRWTVDTPKDLKLAEAVYDELFQKKPNFNMQDILDLISKKRELASLNTGVERSAMYNS